MTFPSQAVDCVCGLKKACAHARKRSGALIYFAVELSKWFVGVAQEPHIRALLPVKMGLELGPPRTTPHRGRHHEMARAKGRGLCKIFPFRRGVGSLVCLVSGRHSDEQIFGTLGLASIC
jgi:hypothetical protein